MSAPNLHKQRVAREAVEALFIGAENVCAIHYSGEGFRSTSEGRSPRLASIACRNLGSGQSVSFSVSQVAEELNMSSSESGQVYELLEKEMLRRFYEYVEARKSSRYLHWHMRDSVYGFPAIEHRYRALGGAPVTISDDRKFDLSKLVTDVYGKDYIQDPKLENLIYKNGLERENFMTGAEEARAFERGEYLQLQWSTLAKVDVIATIAELVADRQLLTNTTWWEMNGGSLLNGWTWIVRNRSVAFVVAFTGFCATMLGCYQSLNGPANHVPKVSTTVSAPQVASRVAVSPP